jgi:hypothetical protein
MARCARSEISSRCTSCACSITTRRATRFTVSIYVRSLPRTRCLTLALPPNGGGPGSHLGFTNVTLGCPLATRARVGRLTTLERLCSNPPLLVARTVWRARVRHQGKDGRYRGNSYAASSLRSSNCTVARTPASQSGHLREPSLALTRPRSPTGFGSRQVTRFAQMASSPLPHCSARTTGRTRQLCRRSTRCRTQLRSSPVRLAPSLDALAHSDGRKLPRPARTAVRPKLQDNTGRDALHIGQDTSNTARGFAYRRRHQH